MNILDVIINIPGFGKNSKHKPAQLTKFLDTHILRNLVETSKGYKYIFQRMLDRKRLKNDICKQGDKLEHVMYMPRLMRSVHWYENDIPIAALWENGEYFKDQHTLYSEYDATYKNIKYGKIRGRGTDRYVLNTDITYFGKRKHPIDDLDVFNSVYINNNYLISTFIQ
tara:strand:- start:43 stop:546 length:504 start_codon:yes stop_codon:yes gene_type:complete